MQPTKDSQPLPERDRGLLMLQAAMLAFSSFVACGAVALVLLLNRGTDWNTLLYGTLTAAVSGSLVVVGLFWFLRRR